ncbi:hypothetical protein CYY_005811 [Polysphondylium violaceum]|uniref:FNIP repeat-containing protein n=1 Tax=Polysphondylium violaceum TaxID=133409 RepID=A0A8J4PSA0_9MYCE|nr:hypothetical protein CYY_005811 [Polysphondylium violaceum]
MTSITTTDRFYSLWRNRYIRDCIRCNVWRNRVINTTLEYLDDNYRYLSLFAFNDRIEYNIAIHLKINKRDTLIAYVNNKHKELIDSIFIDYDIDVTLLPPLDHTPLQTNQQTVLQQQQQRELLQQSKVLRFDCSLFHQGLRSLSFFILNQHTVGSGKPLPDSITKLNIYSRFRFEMGNIVVDSILAHLPSRLRSLTLPNGLVINTPTCAIPDTLEYFNYGSTHENLKGFVVPPGKRFGKCVLKIKTNQDLEWVTQHTWVHKVSFLIGFEPTAHTLASHITHIDFEFIDGKLEKGMLPISLINLSIYQYDEPLEVGVLPSGLQDLMLETYDYPLEQGHLPDSLTALCLGSYNLPIKPHVLPNNLTRLTMDSFDQEIQANTLPRSLKYLDISVFDESFEHVGPLDNLIELTVDDLHESVATLLQNVRTIEIRTNQISGNVYLKDTAIQNLDIHSANRFSLYPGFLPSSVKKIIMKGFDIKMDNLIPQSCVYLKTDIVEHQTDSFVKY